MEPASTVASGCSFLETFGQIIWHHSTVFQMSLFILFIIYLEMYSSTERCPEMSVEFSKGLEVSSSKCPKTSRGVRKC